MQTSNGTSRASGTCTIALSEVNDIDSPDTDNSSDVLAPAFSPVTTSSSSQLNSSSLSDENTTVAIPPVKLPTFKIVGDNVDKSIKPRQETSDDHTKSLHYFHSFAVQDRCDMSSFNDDPCLCDVNDGDVCVVLPNEDDNATIRKNVTVLVSRVLRKHFTFFQNNVGPIIRHIPHQYSKEMSQKSNVVSINIISIKDDKFSIIHVGSFGSTDKE